MTKPLRMELPPELLKYLNKDQLDNIPLLIILELYRESKLTIRQAAEILNISYREMEDLLKEHKVYIDLIALAKQYNVDFCLTNEIKVRGIAKSEGFNVVGTLGIIYKAFKLGSLNKTDSLSILESILSEFNEFRFHPKLILKIKNQIEND